MGVKTTNELRKLYSDDGVDFKKRRSPTALAERSSHTWFVLKYLLAVNNVKN